MTTSEVISAAIALLALSVSVFTAYATLLKRFQGRIYLKPRVILTRINQVPSIVIGCEITNHGAKSGAVDDIFLVVNYREQNTKSITRFSFLPLLMREDYNVRKLYQDDDFEPFQSISIHISQRVTRFIVFTPSNDSFKPLAGKIELQLFSKNSGESKYRKAPEDISFPVNENYASIWGDPEGKSIMIEAQENNDLREKFMEEIFH